MLKVKKRLVSLEQLLSNLHTHTYTLKEAKNSPQFSNVHGALNSQAGRAFKGQGRIFFFFRISVSRHGQMIWGKVVRGKLHSPVDKGLMWEVHPNKLNNYIILLRKKSNKRIRVIRFFSTRITAWEFPLHAEDRNFLSFVSLKVWLMWQFAVFTETLSMFYLI